MLKFLEHLLDHLPQTVLRKRPYKCWERADGNVQVHAQAQARQAVMIQAEAHQIAVEVDQLKEESLAKLVSVLDGMLHDTATGKAKWSEQLEKMQAMVSTLKTDQEAILERLKLHQEYQNTLLACQKSVLDKMPLPASFEWAEELEKINNMCDKLEASRGPEIEIVEDQPEALAEPEEEDGKDADDGNDPGQLDAASDYG